MVSNLQWLWRSAIFDSKPYLTREFTFANAVQEDNLEKEPPGRRSNSAPHGPAKRQQSWVKPKVERVHYLLAMTATDREGEREREHQIHC